MTQIMTLSIVTDLQLLVEFRGVSCAWVNDGGVFRFIPEDCIVEEGKWTDAEIVRLEFLAIKDESEALAFLNRHGYFSEPVDVIPIEGELTRAKPDTQWGLGSFRDVLTWQELIRSFMSIPPKKWGRFTMIHDDTGFEGPHRTSVLGFRARHRGIIDKFPEHIESAFMEYRAFSIHFEWGKKEHHRRGIIRSNRVLGAILAQTYVQHMFGVMYRFCARKVCQKPYKVKTTHKRKYCCPRCAHYDSVQRCREKARRARQKIRQKRA